MSDFNATARSEVVNHDGPEGRSIYDFFVIGAFKYPRGDASSQRLLTLAQASAAAGRVPLVINDGDSNASVHYLPGTVSTAGGVDYVCFPSARGGRARRLLHRAARPIRLALAFRRFGSPERARWVVLASGLCTPGLLLVLRLVRGYSVVADVVERHDASQFPQGWRAAYFLRHRFTSWLSGVATDRTIVISSRLASLYAFRRPQPLIIPALVDLSEYPTGEVPVDGLGTTLLYIGNPSGKDRLGIVLDAISQIPGSDRRGLRFVIAGPDWEELVRNPDVGKARLDRVTEVVDAQGYLSRDNVLQLLRNADFTVLLRPTGGYADAGFPTKVAESLAAGCPVLCNLTSDLGRYLADGKNAVICEAAPDSGEVTVDTVREALLRAMSMKADERLAMRRNARLSASPLSSGEWGARLAAHLGFES